MKGFLSVIFVLLLSGDVYAQNKLTGKQFFFTNQLCSERLSFVNDSIFLSEGGCEQFYNAFWGQYRIVSDSLILHPGINGLKLQIRKTDTIKLPGDQLVLKFFDQEGVNISRYMRATFVRADKRYYPLSYDSVRKVLFTRKTKNEIINISTLSKFNNKDELVAFDFEDGLELDYYLEVPELVSRFNLYGKNIFSEASNLYMFLSKEGIRLYEGDNRFPLSSDVLYTRVKE